MVLRNRGCQAEISINAQSWAAGLINVTPLLIFPTLAIHGMYFPGGLISFHIVQDSTHSTSGRHVVLDLPHIILAHSSR